MRLRNVGDCEYTDGLLGRVIEDRGGRDVRVMFDIGETCYVLREALEEL